MFPALSSLWTGSLSRTTRTGSDRIPGNSSVDPICDIDDQKDPRTRSLKHLLKLNHVKNAMISQRPYRINILPDMLTAAYTLGLSSSGLTKIFDAQDLILEQWKEAPAEITTLNWTDFFGHPEYQRAYLDFFEDSVVENGYNWQEVIYEYLFGHATHLFARGLNAEGIPLIRLANTLRTNSRELAIETLALFCICQDSSDLIAARSWMASRTPTGSLSMVDVLLLMSRRSKVSSNRGRSTNIVTEENWQNLCWNESQVLLDEMHQTSMSLVQEDLARRSSFGWLLLTSHTLRLLSAYLPPTALVLAQKEWWWRCVYAYAQAGYPSIERGAQELCETSPRMIEGPEFLAGKVSDGTTDISQIQIQAVLQERIS